MYRVGVIGYGLWDPALARNLNGQTNFKLVRIAEPDPILRRTAQKQFPGVSVDSDGKSICEDAHIDVVVIAAPPHLQQEFIRMALRHRKRVIAGATRTPPQRRHRSQRPMEKASRWNFTLFYCVVLFFLSSIPDISFYTPSWLDFTYSDKFAHAILYGGLSIAFASAYWPRRGAILDQPSLLFLPVLFAGAYGITDELHQKFVPGRAFEIADYGADLTGAAVAVLCLAAVRTLHTRR